MHKVHPFDTLTPDFLIAAIESTGAVCDGRMFPLNSYENRVYQIGIEAGEPIIAKFYRPNRWSEDQIRERCIRPINLPMANRLSRLSSSGA